MLLGILLSAYLYDVRGIGVQPQISAPLMLERQGLRRTYAWSQKAPMPSPRTEVTAAVFQGQVVVIGGFDGLARTVATVAIYDPAIDSWRSAPDLPEGRHHAAAVAVGDTLYVIGGYTGMGFEPKADVFALKMGQAWQRLAPLAEARGALAAAALGQKGLRDRWHRPAGACQRSVCLRTF
ncbi:MAG: Kelch repeat-containing protein [Gammaproteobacteria bacterium]